MRRQIDQSRAHEIIKRSDAIKLGLKQYFTARPCPRGHIANRFVNGKGCIACSKQFRDRWVEANPDKVSIQKSRQYSKHKAKFQERARAHRRANREAISKKKKADYEKNGARIRESVRLYAERNRDLVRARNNVWRENNRELVATIDRLKRDRRKGAAGSHTVDDIREIERLQKNKCAYCKCDLRKQKRHIDHIVPISRGGTNDRANLQLLCEFCNLSKHARDPIDFAQSRGLLL